MSRFDDYDYDPMYPNQAELWHANVKRALAGKRGKAALAELREALRALPEPRLIEGALCTVGDPRREQATWSRGDLLGKIEADGEGVCAVGAYVWFKKVKAGMDPQEAFVSLPTLLDVDGGDWETAEAGRHAGLTITLASTLAYKNDQAFQGMTPEERYDAFMSWLDEELAVPA